VKVPQVRGRAAPERAPGWRQGAPTRDGVQRLLGERAVGARAPRARAARLARARGQGGLCQRPGREWRAPGREASAAGRKRELRPEAGASLLLAPGYAPGRRWGQKPGGLGGWALWEEGRKVLLRLSPTTQGQRTKS
jgi:hypothetical protein